MEGAATRRLFDIPLNGWQGLAPGGPSTDPEHDPPPGAGPIEIKGRDSMTFEELKEKAHSLPLKPGVYIMQDA